MSVTEHTDDDTTRMAGITDDAWWHWFNEELDGCYDPWRDWLLGCRFPHNGPMQTWLENDIESAIRSADALRLATTPSTATFTKQWAAFKLHHEELDGRGKYLRMRTMVWRAAALKALCERDCFQDCIDADQARTVLTQTMLWFWPTIDAEGNYDGGNFWRPKLVNCSDGSRQPDALSEYAAMVLLLMRQVLPKKREHDDPQF